MQYSIQLKFVMGISLFFLVNTTYASFEFIEDRTIYTTGTITGSGSSRIFVDETEVFPNKTAIKVKDLINYWKKMYRPSTEFKVFRIYAKIDPEKRAKMQEKIGKYKLKKGMLPKMKTGLFSEEEALDQDIPKYMVEELGDNDAIRFAQDSGKIMMHVDQYFVEGFQE